MPTGDQWALAAGADASESSPGCQQAAVRFVVTGQVQGVGFRPFVYRLARECGLGGYVKNTAAGVVIEVEGWPAQISDFRSALLDRTLTWIADVREQAASPQGRHGFQIGRSVSDRRLAVRIPSDRATCAECVQELCDPANRRHRHPFITCTSCGPRYSLIDAMPYDRSGTTMNRFEMCRVCREEYADPFARRLHNQSNSCLQCGPTVGLLSAPGDNIGAGLEAIEAAARILRSGQIVTVKGLGGFQLLARADSSEAIARLRRRKYRPTKPLAIMVSSLQSAERLADVDAIERQALLAPENPIVLLNRKRAEPEVCSQIAPNLNTLGIMLPTTPLHHLLLRSVGCPVVATSGNRSEEPIITSDEQALMQLAGIADAFLVHDRPIVRALDDSVCRVIAGRATTFRLARGYAPLTLPALEGFGAEPALATGGHQKNAVALFSGAQAILAQHVGDLDDPGTRDVLNNVCNGLLGLYDFDPSLIACDLHPDYFTSHWARQRGVPTIAVQHHHAHAVAAMTEHDLLGEDVLAFAWDGTGFGTDGTIWGGEAIQANAASFHRVASVLPFALPGGDAAIREPRRIAFALLYEFLGREKLLGASHLLRRLQITRPQARLLCTMIHRRVNTPMTSSIGRLFDGVAALVLGAGAVFYEGEAAIWLEAVADENVTESYDFPLGWPNGTGPTSCPRGDWRPMLRSILADLDADASPGVIAARFHNALANWAAAVAVQHPSLKIVLTGGCFQNRFLAERTLHILEAHKRQIYLHAKIPPGDGGLAAGQLAVALCASSRRNER